MKNKDAFILLNDVRRNFHLTFCHQTSVVLREYPTSISIDKILKSLASRTKDTVTSQYLNTTTVQYGSCNQASHSQSQLNHLLRQIAHPVNTDSCNGNRHPVE